MIARTTSPRRARHPHGELRERVGNYVSVKPLQLGNSVSADSHLRKHRRNSLGTRAL